MTTVWVGGVGVTNKTGTIIDIPKTYFRTPADRDKCISEIKATIDKYSKK